MKTVKQMKLAAVIMALTGVAVAILPGCQKQQQTPEYFMIKAVDANTGRGVPLVEFRTSSKLRFYTDSYGVIAFDDPTLMNQQVYFQVTSDGYECEKSDVGSQGVMLQTTPGDSTTIKMQRLNIAERLYRITGQDIYGESAKLGRPAPIKNQALNGKVAGQDTFIETVYKKKIYWFWGDTYGPGSFNGSVSGATSELPGSGGLDPSVGIDLTYFVDSTGFSREMCPIAGPGLVWIDWLVTVPDGNGNERLFAKFSRTKTLSQDYERGIAVFNDSQKQFEKVARMDSWLDKTHASGHPARIREDNKEYIYIADRYGFERVIADSAHLTNAGSYEHYTCFDHGASVGSGSVTLDRDSQGRLVYAWKASTDALGKKVQDQIISSGNMSQDEALWQAQDIDSARAIELVPCSIFWNAYHKCWIMLATECCGAVWYFEGDTPIGPFVYGRKIVTHENYDFYNVGQHPLFDQDGGKTIYFEGTYTTGFSGSTNPTPLYDYNQMMYRLSLDDSRLSLPSPVYRVKDAQGRQRYLMRAAVDSLNLWDHILDIAFYAVPPHRTVGHMIPVYTPSDKNGEKFDTLATATGTDQRAFYALPVNAQAAAGDPISGTWQCTVKMPNGVQESARVQLQLEGQTVSGVGVTRGTYVDGKLDLEMQAGGYTLDGSLQGAKLVGTIVNRASGAKGTWEGQRTKGPAEKYVSPAVVPLYEYQNKTTGERLYSVEPKLKGSNLVRADAPVCCVWKNPSSLVLLDYKAKPVGVG